MYAEDGPVNPAKESASTCCRIAGELMCTAVRCEMSAASPPPAFGTESDEDMEEMER